MYSMCMCVCNYICMGHTVTACFLLLQRRFYPLLCSQQEGVKERVGRRKQNEDEMCDFIVWTFSQKDPSRFCWCFNNLWITMLLLSLSFLPTVLCVHKPLAKTHKYKGEINGKHSPWISPEVLSTSLLYGPQAEYIFASI